MDKSIGMIVSLKWIVGASPVTVILLPVNVGLLRLRV